MTDTEDTRGSVPDRGDDRAESASRAASGGRRLAENGDEPAEGDATRAEDGDEPAEAGLGFGAADGHGSEAKDDANVASSYDLGVVLDHIDAALFVVDANGDLVNWNDAVARLTGDSPAEAKAKNEEQAEQVGEINDVIGRLAGN